MRNTVQGIKMTLPKCCRWSSTSLTSPLRPLTIRRIEKLWPSKSRRSSCQIDVSTPTENDITTSHEDVPVYAYCQVGKASLWPEAVSQHTHRQEDIHLVGMRSAPHYKYQQTVARHMSTASASDYNYQQNGMLHSFCSVRCPDACQQCRVCLSFVQCGVLTRYGLKEVCQ